MASSEQSDLGVIAGTSLLESDLFSDLPPEKVETDHGEVVVRRGEGYVMIQRHHSPEGYTPPHEIDYEAHLSALHQLGVNQIFSVQSTGSLTPELSPGTLVIPDDYFCPWKTITRFDDERGHRVVEYDRDVRREIREAVKSTSFQMTDHGVYAQTVGPRFETPAEAAFLSQFADLVGMTGVSELIYAHEFAIPYASLCSVDNYVNGIEGTQIDMESFQQQVEKHQSKVARATEAVITRFCAGV